MSEYNQYPSRSEARSGDVFSRRVPYGMAYVRLQKWECPFNAYEALANGTAFHSLVKPFGAMEVPRHECC
ncbi:MAG: spore coat associated protein CotJA [Clostridia bacterium]|nr:spore coat associated protein CotJA [Clostridia bacterium]